MDSLCGTDPNIIDFGHSHIKDSESHQSCLQVQSNSLNPLITIVWANEVTITPFIYKIY